MLAGGYTGPTNWYKSMIANTDAPNRAKIPPENTVLKFPVVFIQGKVDYVCRYEGALRLAEQGKKGGWLKDIEVKLLDTGHWIQLEKPKEVFEIFDDVAKKIQG
jgi:pimeloyl-ACP methyl ester carboxylesterase